MSKGLEAFPSARRKLIFDDTTNSVGSSEKVRVYKQLQVMLTTKDKHDPNYIEELIVKLNLLKSIDKETYKQIIFDNNCFCLKLFSSEIVNNEEFDNILGAFTQNDFTKMLNYPMRKEFLIRIFNFLAEYLNDEDYSNFKDKMANCEKISKQKQVIREIVDTLFIEKKEESSKTEEMDNPEIVNTVREAGASFSFTFDETELEEEQQILSSNVSHNKKRERDEDSSSITVDNYYPQENHAELIKRRKINETKHERS